MIFMFCLQIQLRNKHKKKAKNKIKWSSEYQGHIDSLFFYFGSSPMRDADIGAAQYKRSAGVHRDIPYNPVDQY